MALGFKKGYAGAQVRLFESTMSARSLRGRNTAPNERREQHEHVLAVAHAATRAGREEHTHLKHPDHPARRDDELDNDHDGADDDDENGTVTQIMTDDV